MEKRVANARKVCQDLHVIKSSNVKKDAVAMGVVSEENVYVKLVTADRYAKRKLLAQYLSKEIYAVGMANANLANVSVMLDTDKKIATNAFYAGTIVMDMVFATTPNVFAPLVTKVVHVKYSKHAQTNAVATGVVFWTNANVKKVTQDPTVVRKISNYW
jgi:hypothetical protein